MSLIQETVMKLAFGNEIIMSNDINPVRSFAILNFSIAFGITSVRFRHDRQLRNDPRAHAVQPVTALQSEYSLWWRKPEVSRESTLVQRVSCWNKR